MCVENHEFRCFLFALNVFVDVWSPLIILGHPLTTPGPNLFATMWFASCSYDTTELLEAKVVYEHLQMPARLVKDPPLLNPCAPVFAE